MVSQGWLLAFKWGLKLTETPVKSAVFQLNSHKNERISTDVVSGVRDRRKIERKLTKTKNNSPPFCFLAFSAAIQEIRLKKKEEFTW